jgi:hypothetical protein
MGCMCLRYLIRDSVPRGAAFQGCYARIRAGILCSTGMPACVWSFYICRYYRVSSCGADTRVCGVETRLDAFSRCDAKSKPVGGMSAGTKCGRIHANVGPYGLFRYHALVIVERVK